MARTMKVGATFPPMRGQATDGQGNPVDLSTATTLTMIAISGSHTMTGPAVALHPPIDDEDGIHHWNWQYNFAVGDTAVAGTYKVYLKADLGSGEIEFYPDAGSETLTIEAL